MWCCVEALFRFVLQLRLHVCKCASASCCFDFSSQALCCTLWQGFLAPTNAATLLPCKLRGWGGARVQQKWLVRGEGAEEEWCRCFLKRLRRSGGLYTGVTLCLGGIKSRFIYFSNVLARDTVIHRLGARIPLYASFSASRACL